MPPNMPWNSLLTTTSPVTSWHGGGGSSTIDSTRHESRLLLPLRISSMPIFELLRHKGEKQGQGAGVRGYSPSDPARPAAVATLILGFRESAGLNVHHT